MEHGAARGWAPPTAAAIAYLAVEAMRVWLPSLRFMAAGSDPLWLATAAASGTVALALVVLVFIDTPRARAAGAAAVLLLLAGRIVLHLPISTPVRLVVAGAAVAAGLGALAILAASGPDPVGALIGAYLGIALNTVGHLALGTHDVIWRSGALGVLATAALVAATVWTGRRTLSAPGWSRADPSTAAWPWLLPGPVMLLVGALSGMPARTAIAVGWSDATIAATLALAHLLGVAAAIVTANGARSAPPRRAWLPVVGAALVLVGTAGSLLPTGIESVVAQVLLAVGIGLVIGASATVAAPSTPVRRGSAVIVSWLALAAGTTLYYGSYDLAVRPSNRVILLLAAVGVAAAGAVAGRRTHRGAEGQPPTFAPVASARSALIAAGVLSAFVGLAASGPPTTAPAPGDGTFTIAQLNVRSGYDIEGRFAVHDMAAVLADADADLIVLNEVDRGWLLTGGHDVLQLLARELDMTAVFAPAADEVWGNAVLSRFPIDEVNVERLPRGEAPMLRSELVAVVEIAAEQQLAVVGTQLSLRVQPEDGTRLTQARAVAATVARYRERGLPVVVGGSLNAGLDTPELATFDTLVRPLLPDGTLTWPSDAPTEHLDHLLASGDLERVSLSVPFVQVSDHLPVIATLRYAPD